MVLRRHLLSMMTLLILSGSSSLTWAQVQTQAIQPLPANSAEVTPIFVGVFGAVNSPGVFEIQGAQSTVGELITFAGHARPDAVSIGLVRPESPEQIALQKQAFEAQGLTEEQYRGKIVLNRTYTNQTFDSPVYPGDIVVVDSSLTGQPQALAGNLSVAGNQEQAQVQQPVDLMLLNLLDRPVYLQLQQDQTQLSNILKVTGQDDSPEMQSSVMIITTREQMPVVGNPAATPQMTASQPLPAGTVIIFDPSKIKFDSIPETVLNFFPEPIRVAAKPNEGTRTDVPQSDLRTAQVPEMPAPENVVTELNPQMPVQPEIPQSELPQAMEPAEAIAENRMAVPMPEAEAEQVASKLSDPPSEVEVLAPAPELGLSAGIGEGEQFALGTPEIPAVASALPTFTETDDSELQMYADADVNSALANNPTAGGRWNTANIVVIGLLVLTVLTVGWTRFNNKRTAAKSTRPRASRPKARPRPQRASREMMAEEEAEVDPQVEIHRQKIERRRKIHATSRHRDQELEVEALINDMLPVKEEEVNVSHTFHLPGIGQSFRLDPAATELRGPHFRQAAQVHRQNREQAASQVRSEQPAQTNETQMPATGQSQTPTGPTGNNKIHHIHQGGHSPMAARKQSAPSNQGSYQQ